MMFYNYACVLLLFACLLHNEAKVFAASNFHQREGKTVPLPLMRCSSKIRFPQNGSDTTYSVATYLKNQEALPCAGSISVGLMKVFAEGERSAKIRQDLEKKLGHVCSAFVDLISAIAFSREMSSSICVQEAFSNRLLIETDFCGKEDGIMDSAMDTSLVSTLMAFGGHFRRAADAVVSLQALDKDSCLEKCGGGYPRILCNAYYSVASLFSQEYPKLLANKGGTFTKLHLLHAM